MEGVILIVLLALASRCLSAPTKFYDFNITQNNITRLCSSKKIILVNNQFPGPALDVNEGDRVVVRVNNLVNHNITLHWHGLVQNRTGWKVSHASRCRIQGGKCFSYKINLTGQRSGTLWWHARNKFLRATVHGALIVHPKQRLLPSVNGEGRAVILDANGGELPEDEHTVILGEWWKSNTLDTISRAGDGRTISGRARGISRRGRGRGISDALTINGLPGPLYGNCSVRDTHVWNVQPGKRYILRVISAVTNQKLIFGIANHTLAVVRADARSLMTSSLIISPGQTFTIRITTDQQHRTYFIAARAFDSTPSGLSYDNTTTAAVLNYNSPLDDSPMNPLADLDSNPPPFPSLPDADFASDFTNKLGRP